MAVLAILLGGIFGFISFATALIALDYGFLAAFGLYLVVGFSIAAAFIAIVWLPAKTRQIEASTA